MKLRVGSLVTLRRVTNSYVNGDTKFKVLSIKNGKLIMTYGGSGYSTSIDNVKAVFRGVIEREEFVFR